MNAAELRALAQRVVEACEAWAETHPTALNHAPRWREYREAHRALAAALDEPDAGLSVYSARAILAALDDAERVATERVLGEVVARCGWGMRSHEGYLSPRSRGLCAAWEACSDWAQERLDALRESAKGGA